MEYQAKPCRRCGQEFHPISANHRYCSDACRLGEFVCEACNRRFVRTKKSSGRWCSPRCFYDQRYPVGTTFVTSHGYLVEKMPIGTQGQYLKTGGQAPDRWMFQHRAVMQKKLGRPMEPNETVHHIDGNKQNNSPENLELWRKKRHPAGVRSGDYHCPGCRCAEKGN